ncbi:hypothetical protein [Streptomyces sp. NBC_00388]|uniref:hypothetical protein n=1 Tax=Streptomyces sp. NBC_00388 TaxID=2975735 RepID=UPI002E1E9D16
MAPASTHTHGTVRSTRARSSFAPADLKDQQPFITSTSSNSSKSDFGPADWKPTNNAFWCTYGEDYTHINSVFKLTTTGAEKTALASMLDTCA